MSVAQAVAAGDLTRQIMISSKDETGQLMQPLKEMNDSLLTIAGEVRSCTETIATASNQIASGNLDLSSRTGQQASSLEETASSMEELTSTVQQNAHNAGQANPLAAAASQRHRRHRPSDPYPGIECRCGSGVGRSRHAAIAHSGTNGEWEEF
jgi:methyl-accepting chemotaxis protein